MPRPSFHILLRLRDVYNLPFAFGINEVARRELPDDQLLTNQCVGPAGEFLARRCCPTIVDGDHINRDTQLERQVFCQAAVFSPAHVLL